MATPVTQLRRWTKKPTAPIPLSRVYPTCHTFVPDPFPTPAEPPDYSITRPQNLRFRPYRTFRPAPIRLPFTRTRESKPGQPEPESDTVHIPISHSTQVCHDPIKIGTANPKKTKDPRASLPSKNIFDSAF